jgi:hypothetical protein
MATTAERLGIVETKVQGLDDKIDELKVDVKEMHDCLDRSSHETRDMLKEMREEGTRAHKELASKISALEKWRWMMMGAGIVLGSLVFDIISKILK